MKADARLLHGIRHAPLPREALAGVLSGPALEALARLHAGFEPRRQELLAARRIRQGRIANGERLGFRPETEAVRRAPWRVGWPPHDLTDRRVEITGPTERKMMINALNSGAQCFMADFEDANCPTWANMLEGQANLMDAARGTLSHTSPDGRLYEVRPHPATLLVRPRGWHLDERHVLCEGQPLSASLFDAGLFVFHNARQLLDRGSGPYLYLPKMESHLEARLWNEALGALEAGLGIPEGSVRVTVLVETLPAAFEMEEILYELRHRSPALNAGRWDYLFSVIKTLREEGHVLPDRSGLTMDKPFLQAYARLLVKTCHKRGAYAIGGMSAYVPSRTDAEANARAFAKVEEDKLREAREGFDGTWVAHPDLVPVAAKAFRATLDGRLHQVDRQRDDVAVGADDLLDLRVPGLAGPTQEGLRTNVRACLHYLAAWLGGQGAVAIDSLMEDTATAEISRAQVWQWRRRGVRLASGPLAEAVRKAIPLPGRRVDEALVQDAIDEALAALRADGSLAHLRPRLDDAAQLLRTLTLGPWQDFLTVAGAPLLLRGEGGTPA